MDPRVLRVPRIEPSNFRCMSALHMRQRKIAETDELNVIVFSTKTKWQCGIGCCKPITVCWAAGTNICQRSMLFYRSLKQSKRKSSKNESYRSCPCRKYCMANSNIEYLPDDSSASMGSTCDVRLSRRPVVPPRRSAARCLRRSSCSRFFLFWTRSLAWLMACSVGSPRIGTTSSDGKLPCKPLQLPNSQPGNNRKHREKMSMQDWEHFETKNIGGCLNEYIILVIFQFSINSCDTRTISICFVLFWFDISIPEYSLLISIEEQWRAKN